MGQEIVIRTVDLAAQEWVADRDAMLAQASEQRAVIDDTDFAAATALVAKLSKHRRELEEQRKAVTQRIDAIKKDIMAQERDLAGDIDTEYARLRDLCGEYATHQAAMREAAERARREAQAEAAMSQQAAQDAFGADAVITPEVAPVVPTRPIAAGGRRQVVKYEYEITDVTRLDRKFLAPDPKKISAFVQYIKAQGIEPDAVDEPGLKITKHVVIN